MGSTKLFLLASLCRLSQSRLVHNLGLCLRVWMWVHASVQGRCLQQRLLRWHMRNHHWLASTSCLILYIVATVNGGSHESFSQNSATLSIELDPDIVSWNLEISSSPEIQRASAVKPEWVPNGWPTIIDPHDLTTIEIEYLFLKKLSLVFDFGIGDPAEPLETVSGSLKRALRFGREQTGLRKKVLVLGYLWSDGTASAWSEFEGQEFSEDSSYLRTTEHLIKQSMRMVLRARTLEIQADQLSHIN